MAESADLHPTAGRRRREKGPPSGLALPRLERVSDTESEHSDDSAGEKEAKRQRSEPTTPVSTSSRLPYEYDALMGITKVGTKEAEGFEEDLDSTEYHDANDEPTRKDEVDNNVPQQRSMGFQGGYGSSSLKECIELLNATVTTAPAPLDSGVGQKSTDPSRILFLEKIGNHFVHLLQIALDRLCILDVIFLDSVKSNLLPSELIAHTLELLLHSLVPCRKGLIRDTTIRWLALYTCHLCICSSPCETSFHVQTSWNGDPRELAPHF